MTMRITHGKLIKEMPMEMLIPLEKQAIHNHGQTLKRLNERGGLDVGEALAILKGCWFDDIKTPREHWESELIALIDKFKEKQNAA
jgi:hypothetical protein